MLHYLPCRVLPGFFDFEFYVMIEASSAYVPRAVVHVSNEPSNAAVDGKLEVIVIERDPAGGRALIEMPGEPVIGSARSWVPSNILTEAALA